MRMGATLRSIPAKPASLPSTMDRCHTLFSAFHRAELHCMPEVFVAKAAQFPDGERRIVAHGGREIGVFHWQGKFYAYENLCVHQGGPACEGIMMHKVEDVLGSDRSWLGQKFSSEEIHFVCPWHGYEYDLKTGECAADRNLKLKKFEVLKRGEDIYVVAS
jgi:nitrite reductase/ring-hydroxylating ferredoxin subunit